MMAYDMVLKWRPGKDNSGPDALSRLRRRGPLEPDIDTSLPGDTVEDTQRKGPQGPVLDGTPLQQLAPPMEEEEEQMEIAVPPELAMLENMPRDHTQWHPSSRLGVLSSG